MYWAQIVKFILLNIWNLEPSRLAFFYITQRRLADEKTGTRMLRVHFSPT